MQIRLAILAGFSLFVLIMAPAYADVQSLSLGSTGKSYFTTDENFYYTGTQDGKDTVFVIIRDSAGDFKGMMSDPNPDENAFSVIPRPVANFFESQGIYNATAFTDEQKESDGITIKIEFDGKKIFEVPDFVLALKTISDKTIEEKKTLTFTAQLTEAVDGAVFSLEKNPPKGATINSETGKFSFTPTETQGPGAYTFDIVVTKGAQVDRETVKVTVTEKVEPVSQPTPIPKPTPTAEPKEEKKEITIPAPFVDETKDPQYYVDRYNNEPKYKTWFDANYPEYSSIYQAVGLEEPKELAAFVDPNQDPQYYVDRYNNEPKYKTWFDKTYPDITIYEAVGLEEPKVVEPEFGECGQGTKLIDGKCTIVKESKEGGGCLIATATYGSEIAPQVQFLREIRDNKLMTTESGASFMSGFNKVYYSFSPYVADYERENPAFKEMVKIGITPMLSTLSIMSMADSEQEILVYGIAVIMMNVGMYGAAPAIVVLSVRKFKH